MDNTSSTVDHGQYIIDIRSSTVHHGQWIIDSTSSTLDHGQCIVDIRSSTMHHRQYIIDNTLIFHNTSSTYPAMHHRQMLNAIHHRQYIIDNTSSTIHHRQYIIDKNATHHRQIMQYIIDICANLWLLSFVMSMMYCIICRWCDGRWWSVDDVLHDCRWCIAPKTTHLSMMRRKPPGEMRVP